MNWPPPAVEYGPYRAHFFAGMEDISVQDWNAHNPNAYPFLSHAFLHALETSQSVGREKGMIPMHMQLLQEEQSLGFVPLYLKFHSYGEYIFDWEWARGAQGAGIDYYPKQSCKGWILHTASYGEFGFCKTDVVVLVHFL